MKSTTSEKAKEDFRDKIEKLEHEKAIADHDAKEYSGAYTGLLYDSKNKANAKKAYEADKHPAKYKDNSEVLSKRQNAAARFKQIYHDNSKEPNYEPNRILKLQDKKRAIKETCLNILSVIDEL